MSLFGAVAVALLAGGGCGRIAESSPALGDEPPFLHSCNGSCAEGLECIGGLCTQPCAVTEPNACSAFLGASCIFSSVEPGAVAICDVGCIRDSDCAGLGSDYQCVYDLFCRGADASSAEMSGAGAVDAEIVSVDHCASCLEGRYLKWGSSRGLPEPYDTQHWSELSNCNEYLHTYTWAYGNVDGPLPSCQRSVDGCPSQTLALLSALARDPQLQAALPEQRLFGADERREGGNVFQISVSNPDGSNGHVRVGSPCNGLARCTEIPPVIARFVTELQAFDAVQLAEAACASVFPDGTASSYPVSP